MSRKKRKKKMKKMAAVLAAPVERVSTASAAPVPGAQAQPIPATPVSTYEAMIASITKKDILKTLIIILCLFAVQTAIFIAKGKGLL